MKDRPLIKDWHAVAGRAGFAGPAAARGEAGLAGQLAGNLG